MPSSCSAPNSNTFTPLDLTNIAALSDVTMHMEPLSGQYYTNVNVSTVVTLAAKSPISYPSAYNAYFMPQTVYGAGYGSTHAPQSAGLAPGRLGTGEGEQFRPRLRAGNGSIPTRGGCFVEVASHLYDGESWTDQAPHIESGMRSLAICANDWLPDEPRQGLLELAPRLNQVTASTPQELKAAAWLRMAARAVQLSVQASKLGSGVVEELPQLMRAFVQHPTPGPLGLVETTTRHSWFPQYTMLMGMLNVAMTQYAQGRFTDAYNGAWALVSGVLVGRWDGGGGCLRDAARGVAMLGEMLQVWESAVGTQYLPGLADVPAGSWARMHRAVYGLAA